MSAEPAEAPPPPAARLNPFIFPSETTFRFALLVFAVLGANLYVWNWLWIAHGSNERTIATGYLECETIRPAPELLGINADAYTRAHNVYADCVTDVTGPLAYWMIGGTALLLAVAALILFLFPYWIVRRRGLRPLTREEAPAVVEELEELAQEAELEETPSWRWNPLDPSPTGISFGRPGSHVVALMGGLVTRQFADPPAFRAVVRHELAHLRNRDVDLTYATLSLWYAFLLVGLLPFAVVVADEGLRTIISLGWRLLALTVLVYLTRNAVLRAREIFADVRASVPDGEQGALRRLLGAMPRRATSLWRGLWRVHPDPHVRLAAVNDTRGLFSLGVLAAFGAGVAATVAYDSLVTFVGLYVRDPLSVRLVAALTAAPLVMGVVGIGVWRGTWAALTQGRRRPPTWALALALTAGFLVGPQLALERAVRPEGNSTVLETGLGSGAPWIVLLAVAFVLLLGWVGSSAERWIRAPAGADRPARAALGGLLLASGVLAVLVAVFNYARDSRSLIGTDTAVDYTPAAGAAWVGPEWLWNVVLDVWTFTLYKEPMIVLGLAALWLVPFAAWLRRKALVSDAPWAFLDGRGSLHIPLLGRVPLEPVRIGLILGAACVVALIVLRASMRYGFDEDTLDHPGIASAYTYWVWLIAIGAQAVAGAVAAARMRELPLVGALAAAFIVAAIASVGIETLPMIGGCVDPLAVRPAPCSWDVAAESLWLNFRTVAAEGAVAALAGGLVMLGVQAVLHRRHAPVPAPTA